MVSSNGYYLQHWVESNGGRCLDSATELLETRQRVGVFCQFQHFHGTYTTCGDLTLNKQAYLESNTVVSCINAMICLLSHQCEICPPCIQQLLHYSEMGKFRLPAIFAKLNRCYFCVVVALCVAFCVAFLCLEFDSGCIKKKKDFCLFW